MSILSQIHHGIKTQHKATDSKPFVARYKEKDLLLVDHYRHLCQLLPIYEALEKSLKSAGFSILLPPEMSELLTRSEKIKNDLKFLKRYLSADDQIVLPKTKAYVDQIEKDVAINDEKLFSHFLLRILGDLFGGQKIKSHVEKLYARNKISSEKGLSFYQFQPKALANFSFWLNNQTFHDLEKMIEVLNEGLIAHQNIFAELEKTRVVSRLNCNRFFSVKNVVTATVTLATVAAAAYALS